MFANGELSVMKMKIPQGMTLRDFGLYINPRFPLSLAGETEKTKPLSPAAGGGIRI